MTREFLKNLGLEDTVIDSILQENTQDVEKEKQKTRTVRTDLADAKAELTAAQTELESLKQSSGDAAAVQQQLANLQAKYDTDTGALRDQLAERDYSDAISKAITGKGLKFSSKAAERAFKSALKEKKLELKDGELTGVDDFIKEQREFDPDAFLPDKPVPRFSGPCGTGGAPEEPVPANVAQAKEIGAARAKELKASGTVLKNFM